MHAFHAGHGIVVAEPDGPRAVGMFFDRISTGRKVAGRWCCGQLNSTPPETHGPASPTRAGLITVCR